MTFRMNIKPRESGTAVLTISIIDAANQSARDLYDSPKIAISKSQHPDIAALFKAKNHGSADPPCLYTEFINRYNEGYKKEVLL